MDCSLSEEMSLPRNECSFHEASGLLPASGDCLTRTACTLDESNSYLADLGASEAGIMCMFDEAIHSLPGSSACESRGVFQETRCSLPAGGGEFEYRNIYEFDEVSCSLQGGGAIEPRNMYVPGSGDNEPGTLNHCQSCGFMSFFLSTMENHICSEAPSFRRRKKLTPQNFSAPVSSPQRMSSVECYGKASKKTLVQKHVKMKNLYGCTKCDYTSAHKNNVLRHLRLVHKMAVLVSDLIKVPPSSINSITKRENTISIIDYEMIQKVVDVRCNSTSPAAGEFCCDDNLNGNRNGPSITNTGKQNGDFGMPTPNVSCMEQFSDWGDIFNSNEDFLAGVTEEAVISDDLYPVFNYNLGVASRKQIRRIFHCKICQYKSPLKWNLARHMRSHQSRTSILGSTRDKTNGIGLVARYLPTLTETEHRSTELLDSWPWPHRHTLSDHSQSSLPNTVSDHNQSSLTKQKQDSTKFRADQTDYSLFPIDAETKFQPSALLKTQSSNNLLTNSPLNQFSAPTDMPLLHHLLNKPSLHSIEDTFLLSTILGSDSQYGQPLPSSLTSTHRQFIPATLPPTTLCQPTIFKTQFNVQNIKSENGFVKDFSLLSVATNVSRKRTDAASSSCYICGVTIQSEEEMQMHLVSAHSSDKACYSCSMCALTYRRQSDLNRHVRVKHSDNVDSQSWEYASIPPLSTIYGLSGPAESHALCLDMAHSDHEKQEPLNLTTRHPTGASAASVTQEQDEPLDLSVTSTSHSQVFDCQYVANVLPRSGPLLTLEQRSDQNQGESRYNCTACYKGYRLESHLIEHWRVEHQDNTTQMMIEADGNRDEWNKTNEKMEHNSYQAHEAKYDLHQTQMERCTMKQSKEEGGYNLYKIHKHGYNLHQLQEDGYNLHQLQEEGYTFEKSRDMNYNNDQFQKKLFSIDNSNMERYKSNKLLNTSLAETTKTRYSDTLENGSNEEELNDFDLGNISPAKLNPESLDFNYQTYLSPAGISMLPIQSPLLFNKPYDLECGNPTNTKYSGWPSASWSCPSIPTDVSSKWCPIKVKSNKCTQLDLFELRKSENKSVDVANYRMKRHRYEDCVFDETLKKHTSIEGVRGFGYVDQNDRMKSEKETSLEDFNESRGRGNCLDFSINRSCREGGEDLVPCVKSALIESKVNFLEQSADLGQAGGVILDYNLGVVHQIQKLLEQDSTSHPITNVTSTESEETIIFDSEEPTQEKNKSMNYDICLENLVSSSTDEEYLSHDDVENLAQDLVIGSVANNSRQEEGPGEADQKCVSRSSCNEESGMRNASTDLLKVDLNKRRGFSRRARWYKSYQCSVCGQRFNWKCELATHIRIVHPSVKVVTLDARHAKVSLTANRVSSVAVKSEKVN